MKEYLVSEILKQSNAKLIADAINEHLQKEREKRVAFYEIIDEDTKAEFINGEILYHSPVKKKHTDATGLIYKLMHSFVTKNNLGFVGFEKVMITLTRNDYEPDVCFFRQEIAQHFGKDHMHYPAPDLAVEVLSSNVANDRVTKFHDYAQHGVSEYWIVDAEEKIVEQYTLKNSEYELQLKAGEGHISSKSITGFKVPIIAFFDEQKNLDALVKLLSD